MNVKEHYLVSMYIAYNHALYKSYSNIGYIKTRFVSLLLYFWFKVFHFFRWNTNYVETLGREESMFMNKLDETKSSSSIPSLYWFQGYIFLYLKPGYIQFITFFWVGNYFVYFMNSIFLWRFPLYEIKTCVFFDVTSLGKVIYEILHVLLTFTVNLIYWLRTIYLKKKHVLSPQKQYSRPLKYQYSLTERPSTIQRVLATDAAESGYITRGRTQQKFWTVAYPFDVC